MSLKPNSNSVKRQSIPWKAGLTSNVHILYAKKNQISFDIRVNFKSKSIWKIGLSNQHINNNSITQYNSTSKIWFVEHPFCEKYVSKHISLLWILHDNPAKLVFLSVFPICILQMKKLRFRNITWLAQVKDIDSTGARIPIHLCLVCSW